MAKIIFLGTAGDPAVMGKQLRASGGFILQIDDLQFHFDPGPGSLNKMRDFGINPHHTTAILVTHNHINHCNDVNAVIDAMTHGGIEHRGVILGSKSLFLPVDGNYPVLTKYHLGLVEKVIPMELDHKVAMEFIEINALPVDHTDSSAVGFKLFCPRFTLAYTGDTAFTPELVESLKGSDILILNVPYPEDKAIGKNLDTHTALEIINQVRPKLAILTHFGLEMLKTDPLNEAREIQRLTGIQTIAAQDGLAITPEGQDQSYSPVKGY